MTCSHSFGFVTVHGCFKCLFTNWQLLSHQEAGGMKSSLLAEFSWGPLHAEILEDNQATYLIAQIAILFYVMITLLQNYPP